MGFISLSLVRMTKKSGSTALFCQLGSVFASINYSSPSGLASRLAVNNRTASRS